MHLLAEADAVTLIGWFAGAFSVGWILGKFVATVKRWAEML